MKRSHRIKFDSMCREAFIPEDNFHTDELFPWTKNIGSKIEWADYCDERYEHYSDLTEENNPTSARDGPFFKPYYEAKEKIEEKKKIEAKNLTGDLKTGPEDEVGQANECTVCMDNPKNTLLLPCKHVCVCTDCSDSIDQCPLCRKDVKERMKVFI